MRKLILSLLLATTAMAQPQANHTGRTLPSASEAAVGVFYLWTGATTANTCPLNGGRGQAGNNVAVCMTPDNVVWMALPLGGTGGGSNPTGSAGIPYWTSAAWSGTQFGVQGTTLLLQLAAVGAAAARCAQFDASLNIVSETLPCPVYATGGGAAQAQTITPSPAVAALTLGMNVCWLPTAANTGAGPTLAVSGLAAKPITKLGAAALILNDINPPAIACALYDGTEFQLQNPQTATGGGGTYTADNTTLNLVGGVFSANLGPGGLESRTTGPSGLDTTCVANTGSTTDYHGAMLGKALAAYAEGMRFLLNSDVANAAGPVTVDCGPGPLRVYRYDGSTDPLAAQIGAIGQTFLSYSLSLHGGLGGFRILSGPTGSYTGAQTIASGSTAMGTTAIAGGACATVSTVTASGVVSTDRITFNANGSIKAVTGYTPGGGITINAYPTANAINFDQCNALASGSTTPGAITVNWGVTR